jgi:hypothetical protein
MPSYRAVSELLIEGGREMTHDIHACGISRTKFLQVGSLGTLLLVLFTRKSKSGLILALENIENDLSVLIL